MLPLHHSPSESVLAEYPRLRPSAIPASPAAAGPFVRTVFGRPVSRQHAAVNVTSDGAFVEDLQSRNGTLVNGLPLASRRRLENRDEIGVRGQRLVFATARGRRARG